jgi:hypothetical protein
MPNTSFAPPSTAIIDTTNGQLTEIGRIYLRTLGSAVGALAPTDAQYWLSTSAAALSNERNLGALASGYLTIATALGIATPSTTLTIPMGDVAGLTPALALLRSFVPRAVSVTSSATPTPNADTTDLYSLTAQGSAAAFANPTGTPSNGQALLIRIKDNGTARGLTWGTAYVAGGAALPSTTVLSKILTLSFIYNSDNALLKWQLLSAAQET